jgi:hypothetical protein
MRKKHSKHSKRSMKGDGFIEDIGRNVGQFFNDPKVKGAIGGIDKFLKQSKLASKVGQVLLPAAGGALAGLATANPLGAAAGGAAGLALNDFLKAQGYGKMKGKGYINRLSQLGSGNNTSLQGYTVSYNGTFQPIQRGMGQTAAFGSLSSEYGKVKF